MVQAKCLLELGGLQNAQQALYDYETVLKLEPQNTAVVELLKGAQTEVSKESAKVLANDAVRSGDYLTAY